MSQLPTLYQYYTENGIKKGLSADQTNFSINNKSISIYSGALHYFRVHPKYWRDRLRKLRAAGLNCIETYVPWNLHEPTPGKYDFGNGGTDFEQFLDIVSFIKIAQEEDLFVILRPGPYICAEWDFGGLPSWLLRYPNIKIRTSDSTFMAFARNFLKQLLKLVKPLQFTKGGPIIAFQIENEYGNTKIENEPIDTSYLEELKDLFLENGIVELLFTSDTPSNGFYGTVNNVLATANFQSEPEKELKILKEFQPEKPLMVMEYWTGWFDHWTEKHHTRTAEEFGTVLEKIIEMDSSFNLYMFHGGTNWGFMNGGNLKDSSVDNAGYQPDITSYDYDAPLSESGEYGEKFYKLMEILKKHNHLKVKHPSLPEVIKPEAYNSLSTSEYLSLDDMISKSVKISSKDLKSMEELDINESSGQSYGYIVYRKEGIDILANSTLKIEGRVCDTAVVLINGKIKSKILKIKEDLDDFGYWRIKDGTLNLGSESYKNATLDLLVENWGRVNYGKLKQFNQKKGLWQGNVLLNDQVLSDWSIVSIEFKKDWNLALSSWKKDQAQIGPNIFKFTLNVPEEPHDTFIDMRQWNKGIVIVNGFVLGRYLHLGPQQTLYLPGPLLKKGNNIILVFEHFIPSKSLSFTNKHIFELL